VTFPLARVRMLFQPSVSLRQRVGVDPARR